MLDLNNYFTVPAAGVQRTHALGVTLISAVPAEAPEAVLRPAREVRERTLVLRVGWSQRLGPAKDGDKARLDTQADSAWRGIHTTLRGLATLTDSPRAEAASVVLKAVFPDGRGFLRLSHKKQWGEAERRLQLIRDTNLAPTITLAVGGTELLERVEATHEAFGVALGITERGGPSLDVDLRLHVSELRDAIRGYMLQVIAWAHSDESARGAATEALAPIAEAREEYMTRRGAAESEIEESPITPDTPLPELP